MSRQVCFSECLRCVGVCVYVNACLGRCLCMCGWTGACVRYSGRKKKLRQVFLLSFDEFLSDGAHIYRVSR